MENTSHESSRIDRPDYPAIVSSIDELCVYRQSQTEPGISYDKVKISIPTESRSKFENARELQVRRIYSADGSYDHPEYLLAFHLAGDDLALPGNIGYIGHYYLASRGQLYESLQIFPLSDEGYEARKQYYSSLPAFIGSSSAGGRVLSEFDLQQLKQKVGDIMASYRKSQNHLYDLSQSQDVIYPVKQRQVELAQAETARLCEDAKLSDLLTAALHYVDLLVVCERRLKDQVYKLENDHSQMKLIESDDDISHLRQMVLRAADFPRQLII